MNQTKFGYAVNAAAGTLGAFVAVYLVHDFWTTESLPICHKRYTTPTEFSLLSKPLTPMTPAELQARVGGREFGVLQNASVIPVANAPAPLAMEIKLPKGRGSVFNDPAKAGGVSFRWDPRGMGGADRACLSYHVMVPENFDFGSAGVLPGLYGGGAKFDAKSAADGINGFATRVAWSANGVGKINLQVPGDDANGLSKLVSFTNFSIAKGKWVAIEQEIALNTPGQPDGLMRLWVDGELMLEMVDVLWRKDARLTLSGVLSDISYGSVDSDASAPADATLNVTPMQVSWKEIKTVQ